ncbi:MAG: hypothetical protein J0H22_03000, partial [Actinobacteria bacterium]|nr:hypothetical protein [Actinomycetota bacterium]
GIREQVYGRLLTLPPEFYRRRPVGDLVARLDGDVAEIQRFSTDTLLACINGVLLLVGTAGVMLVMSWQLTLVAAAEMGRYGVTANAIAPSARTRMTETVFADMMATQDQAFDVMAAENISPLVVWLGSVESRDVTGKVFELEGGKIRIAEGWAHGPEIDKGAKWDPAELGPVVADLLAKARPAVPVYGS